MIQVISDADNELYDDITNELYDQLSEIIERHELAEHYRKHPTAFIIKDIIDALDKAGWVTPSRAKQGKTTCNCRAVIVEIKHCSEDSKTSIHNSYNGEA